MSRSSVILASGIDGVARLDLEDADEARPVAADLVDRLEELGDLELVLAGLRIGEDALEGRERLGVLGLVLEDLAVGLDGAAHLAEALLAQHAEAPEQR